MLTRSRTVPPRRTRGPHQPHGQMRRGGRPQYAPRTRNPPGVAVNPGSEDTVPCRSPWSIRARSPASTRRSVTVEVHLAGGLPAFNLVGLPDTEVKEARDRVRAALQNAQFEFPARKITVNLAPADLPKESGRFDLPIALGILAATGQIPAPALARYEFAGELALTGELRAVRGALPMALSARRDGRAFVLPAAAAAEAALVRDARRAIRRAIAARCLRASGGPRTPVAARGRGACACRARARADLADVRGQTHAKRALEIAAAGGHSLLLIGPPGTGKSMLAQRLPGCCRRSPRTRRSRSPRDRVARRAVRRLAAGACGRIRAPHHTASAVALVGGGSNPRPGEISLAHHGVLFLDELPEWDRRVLEVLREPLETGRHPHLARRAAKHVSRRSSSSSRR